jgi:hypothetical protein
MGRPRASLFTEAERERKRAKDRIYQRRKRERDRQLIAKLKERVNAIETAAGTGPEQAFEPNTASQPLLSFVLEDVQRGTMRPPPKATEETLSICPDSATGISPRSCLALDPDFTICQTTEDEAVSPDNLNNDVANVDHGQSLDTSDVKQLALTTVPAPIQYHTDTDTSLPPGLWRTLNHIYEEVNAPEGHALHDPAHLPSASDFDSHVVISGVLHGWDKVAKIFKFDAVWECLRHVDEMVMSYGGIIERLAALRMISLILRVCWAMRRQTCYPIH